MNLQGIATREVAAGDPGPVYADRSVRLDEPSSSRELINYLREDNNVRPPLTTVRGISVPAKISKSGHTGNCANSGLSQQRGSPPRQLCQQRIVSMEGFTPRACAKTVPKPHRFEPSGGLLSEREQAPQIVDNRHFRMEHRECLEPLPVIRNQQVAGSIPAGGSNKIQHL
jgi:hypothetical protein